MYAIKEEVNIPAGSIKLEGELIIPENVKGIVIFSHGSGSSRFSPRNNFVAEKLHNKGQATLLFDLLTEQEDRVYANRFDIELLTRRLVLASKWVSQQNEIRDLPIGYFGASTGAASALMAAAQLNEQVKAVVSRGGRPDLAMEDLPKVKAATLLIIGALDTDVIQLNESAFVQLDCRKRMEIVPNASHLFEEPGTLEQVADMAANWYREFLK